jgi:hypothetical protein
MYGATTIIYSYKLYTEAIFNNNGTTPTLFHCYAGIIETNN